jgi:hypothetical protein
MRLHGWRCSRSARLNGPVDWLAIIGTIGHHARNLSLDLLEQDWHLASIMSIVAGQHTRDNLAGLGINDQMQLAPGSACPSVSLGIPLAPSEQLQAGAVD